MNTISRTVTGVITIIFGAYLTFLGFSDYWFFLYSIPVLIIGVYILFNKKEDEIEKIKGEKK